MSIDPISLSIAIGAVAIAVITHIKYSSCYGFKMYTRTPPSTTPITPLTPDLKTPLLSRSDPINIVKKEEKRIYL